MTKKIGITVKKSEDFSEWYTQVVKKTELADYASVKGFMVLMPYGYAMWDKIREILDSELRKLKHKNAYFPSLIPESFLKKEASHFEGFTPEVFWVTHTGDNELPERLAVRPTSETIIYDSYSRWVKSWRDLPLLINVWNSVLRAEITSTKPFIRSSEFLWQEGHTVHETKEDTDTEVFTILEVYRKMIEEYLAIPVITGYKSDQEKFVGALYTTTLEALMPDGKALQMGTSHNLGQNFSKAFEIKYLGRDEKEHYAWNASWGVSWRLIGSLIMVHGDDQGLILPPKIAPIQLIIIPIFYSEQEKEGVTKRIGEIASQLKNVGIRYEVDDRTEYTPGWKYNQWEMKGIPLRIELGPKDVQNQVVTLARRDTRTRERIKEEEAITHIIKLVDEIQQSLYTKAKKFLDEHITEAKNYEEFNQKLNEKMGIIKAIWCTKRECEEVIKQETGATIRAISFDEKQITGPCFYCGEEGRKIAYFAKAY
ncbi:proline--tRNA ligase [[Eubacterium] cellulosolvens]